MKKISAATAAVMTLSLLSGCGATSDESLASQLLAETTRPSNHQNVNNSVDFGESDGLCYEEAAPAEDYYWDEPYYDDPLPENSEEYNYITENGYTSVATSPLSTFSADVDTASYTNVRRMIYDNDYINPDAVRIEEFINYFSYGYDDPKDGEPFSIYTELSKCPWNSNAELLMLGISTEKTENFLEERDPMNLVFLIDVSGSMYSDDKLPLVQKSFSMLTENLTPADRISIVTYAGADEVLLDGADGGDSARILETINNLEAGGSTAGAAGINTAYEIAEKHFIKGGTNRIILATDGDLNVGLSSEAELTRLVEEKRENGVTLSVLGFGTGNYKDNRLEALADNGNGNYSYIDSEREARKVLVEEMSGTLLTVAKDVKFQVEFNPANVSAYRLVGYENRVMADGDFDDDTKDAGEIGAGRSVTVLYEIIRSDGSSDDSGLKYTEIVPTGNSDDLLTVSIRYKEPDGDESKLIEHPVSIDLFSDRMSEDMTFASACAEFGMLLRGSEYAGDITYGNIATQLSEYDYSSDEFKDEFIYLVNTMKRR